MGSDGNGVEKPSMVAATLDLEDTNVCGYDNTGWDLVLDLLGATIAGLWLMRSTRAAASSGGGARPK